MLRQHCIAGSQVESDMARSAAEWDRLREKWEAANKKSEREMREAANTLVSLGRAPPVRKISESPAAANKQEAAQTLFDMIKAPPTPSSPSNTQQSPSDADVMKRAATMLVTMSQDPATAKADTRMEDTTQDAAPTLTETCQDEQCKSPANVQPPPTTADSQRCNLRRNARNAPKYNFKAARRPRKTRPNGPTSTARPPPFLAAIRADGEVRMEAERMEAAAMKAAPHSQTLRQLKRPRKKRPITAAETARQESKRMEAILIATRRGEAARIEAAHTQDFIAAKRAEDAARGTGLAGVRVGGVVIDLTGGDEMQVEEPEAPNKNPGLRGMTRHLLRAEPFRAPWRNEVAREKSVRAEAAREHVRMLWQ